MNAEGAVGAYYRLYIKSNSRRAEIDYRERDRLMGDVPGIMRATRDLLKAIFTKSVKKLGEWGFEVNDSPRPKKGK